MCYNDTYFLNLSSSGEVVSNIKELLGKIRVIFIGDDENLAKIAKEACADTKAFFVQKFDEFALNLNARKDFDIVLLEMSNEQSFEFIEDMSYENVGCKIIAIESNAQSDKSDEFLSKALDLMSVYGCCMGGGGGDVCLSCKPYKCDTHKGYACSL